MGSRAPAQQDGGRNKACKQCEYHRVDAENAERQLTLIRITLRGHGVAHERGNPDDQDRAGEDSAGYSEVPVQVDSMRCEETGLHEEEDEPQRKQQSMHVYEPGEGGSTEQRLQE